MDFLLSPLNLFWILLFCAAIFYKFKRKKVSRNLSVTAITVLFIFTVSPLPVLLGRMLEQQYAVHQPNADSTLPVLVLGGGHVADTTVSPLHRLTPAAVSRLSEGIRQTNLSPGRKLITSGYAGDGAFAQARMLAEAAVSLGASPNDTLMMTKPSTTWEEAKEYKRRFGTQKRFILVTTASHMPRAVEIFRRNGLEPVPAPADFLFKRDPNSMLYNWWPSSYKLACSERVLHEYVGIAYYRWIKK